MSFSLDDPPNSRLFVVAGRNTSSDFLRSVFEQYGQVSFVKYLRDKGVAYVKFDRASSAALAIESLHEVTLNDGHGPRLKVMLAESPQTRTLPGLQTRLPDDEAALDPDNTPPRSRLFMVVPKNSDGSIIEAEMSRFAGMQYCKTDLIASKGIVFVKYATSSSACMAMEAVQVSGTVAGYKVKIMLAEPKTRRNDMVGGAQFLPGLQAPRMGGAPGHVAGGFPGGSMASQLLPPISASLLAPGMDFSTIQSAVGNIAAAFPQGIPNLGGHGAPQLDVTQLRGQQGLGGSGFAGLGVPGLGNDMSYMGLGAFSNLSLAPQMLGSGSDLLQPQQQLQELDTFQQMPVPQGAGGNTRLFIVVHKGVGEEDLAPIFQCFPGMEYLDLKRDRMTGRSKGYAYVNYATPGAAAAAQAQLNGIEYPQGSGCRLKVLFAEPLSMSRSRSDDSAGHPLDAAAAARAALLANPSQDAINSFRLPSPPSGDSVAQLGSLGTGHQQQQQHSARTDMSSASHDSIISPNSSPLRMNSDAGMQGQLDAQHIELGSVQNGLSTLSLGLSLGNTAANNSNNSHGAVGNAFHTSPHSTSRGSGGHSDSGDGAGSWRESSPDNHSATSNGGAKSLPSPGDPTVVYSALHRPLPDYALSHVFQQCGSVEYVRVLADEGVALVKYKSPDAAALALGSLNGVEVLGETLKVRSSPPLGMQTSMAGMVGGGRKSL